MYNWPSHYKSNKVDFGPSFLDSSVVSGAGHGLLETLGSLGFCDITLSVPLVLIILLV